MTLFKDTQKRLKKQGVSTVTSTKKKWGGRGRDPRHAEEVVAKVCLMSTTASGVVVVTLLKGTHEQSRYSYEKTCVPGIGDVEKFSRVCPPSPLPCCLPLDREIASLLLKALQVGHPEATGR